MMHPYAYRHFHHHGGFGFFRLLFVGAGAYFIGKWVAHSEQRRWEHREQFYRWCTPRQNRQLEAPQATSQPAAQQIREEQWSRAASQPPQTQEQYMKSQEYQRHPTPQPQEQQMKSQVYHPQAVPQQAPPPPPQYRHQQQQPPRSMSVPIMDDDETWMPYSWMEYRDHYPKNVANGPGMLDRMWKRS